MKREMSQIMPEARREGLVVQELSDEVLVYDRERNKAHCLNRTAALVWSHCDGSSSVAEMARAIAGETNAPVSEDLIWLGVEQLSKTHLLEKQAMPEIKSGLSRREVMRRIGLTAAAAAPIVTSIVAPTAAQAANCIASGQSCTTSAQCCTSICNAGTCA